MSDFAIECALIDAENRGLGSDDAVQFAASSNNVAVSEAERVYDLIYRFQDRIADRLGIMM